MEFNKLVFKELGIIFKSNNLHIIEQSNNHVKLKSKSLVITLIHDERENSNGIYVGSNEDFLYPVNEFILKNAFNSNVKIDNVTPEVFLNSLCIFFENDGKSLISGNQYALEVIKKYVYNASETYTDLIVNTQILEAANKAWDKRNYKEFIIYIDKLDKQILPESYLLKYKIAIKKLV